MTKTDGGSMKKRVRYTILSIMDIDPVDDAESLMDVVDKCRELGIADVVAVEFVAEDKVFPDVHKLWGTK